MGNVKMNRGAKIRVRDLSIAREILSKKFAACELGACRHACCKDGAVAGEGRINKIKVLLPKLFPLMRPEAVKAVQSKCFHVSTVFTRSDMDPSHKHYYFRTVKGRCVFLAYNDTGGCVLQKYAAMNNMKYKLKPVGCWAFPFDLIGNRLVLYKWKSLPCLDDAKNRKARPVYETCKNELIGLLGRKEYQELLTRIKILGENSSGFRGRSKGYYRSNKGSLSRIR